MSSAIALCSAIAVPAGAVPEWLHLLPAGEVRTTDGRGPYRAVDVSTLIAASMSGGKLALDENHATDLAAPKGGPSPARGWIVALQQRADGIWGRVEWTGTGRQMMVDKAYRGVSPVIGHRPDGTISAILRASLTNTPNLTGLVSLHSQAPPDLAWVAQRLRTLKAEMAQPGLTPAELAAFRVRMNSLRADVDALVGTSSASNKPEGPSPGASLSAADLDIIRITGVDPKAYAETKRAERPSAKKAARLPVAPRPSAVSLNAIDLALCRAMEIDPAQYAADVEAQTIARQSALAAEARLTPIELDICQRMGLDPVKFAQTRA